MFKSTFQLSENQGIKTWFHKKYRVFDSCGSVYFETKNEALVWIRNRSSALEISLEKLISIYKTLNSYYLDKFFHHSSDNNDSLFFNTVLVDILGSFHYLTKSRYKQNHLTRLKNIITELLKLSRKFGYLLLEKQLLQIQETVCYNYPVFNSNNAPKALQYKILPNQKQSQIVSA